MYGILNIKIKALPSLFTHDIVVIPGLKSLMFMLLNGVQTISCSGVKYMYKQCYCYSLLFKFHLGI